MTSPIHIRRHEISLVPESARVILRPFIPAGPQRITTIIGRALALSEEEAVRDLNAVLKDFDARHVDIESPLLANYEKVVPHIFTQRPLSKERKLLIGALFSVNTRWSPPRSSTRPSFRIPIRAACPRAPCGSS